MAILNASSLIAAQKTFRALFLSSGEAATPQWQQVAMEVPSDNAEENHQWLGRVPGMKKWVDKKTLEELRGMNFIITNEDWEDTIAVDRNDFEDDKLGLYRPRIQELGIEAVRHPDELVSQARIDGATKLCYDGQFFYDTDHLEGKSGSQSNLLTGTGTTVAQIATDFRAARAKLRKTKDDQGKPFVRRTGVLDLIATIPSDLEGQFEELNNPAPGATTPKISIKNIVDPYLTDVNDWYLDYVGAPIKSFILQMRKRAEFVELTNSNASEVVFMQKKFLFGVEARYNAGFGLWQYSFKTTNT